MRACLCIFILFISSFSVCHAQPADSKHKVIILGSQKKEKTKAPPGSNPTKKNESDVVPHTGDWEPISFHADQLIDEQKFQKANDMLTSILPRAKKEAPYSLDYALTLCRLSTDLYALKKYPQALSRAQEAIEVLNHASVSARQRRIMWRCMETKVAILLALNKNIEAEALARKTVAYSIAFPDVAKANQIKIVYKLLCSSLGAQKKFEEAKKVNDIINQL